MTPYFSLVLTERPLFSVFSLSPKDPYFGGRGRTYPSLPYVSAPRGIKEIFIAVKASKVIHCEQNISSDGVLRWKNDSEMPLKPIHVSVHTSCRKILELRGVFHG